jgi:hypothetical protein
MKSINNWDKVQATTDGYATLPVGGYICTILKCEEKPNKSNSSSHLEIWFDISAGDYAGFFGADYARQQGENKYWRGIVYQNIPDENSEKYNMQCGFFKRFTNALEASNEGYHWDWNETMLKGKKIGVVFGEVERESSKTGNRYFITRPDSVTDIQSIEETKYRVPKPKYLPKTMAENSSDVNELDEKDLPF